MRAGAAFIEGVGFGVGKAGVGGVPVVWYSYGTDPT
jgi:hypothetical protein